jgi:hypothetical protein
MCISPWIFCQARGGGCESAIQVSCLRLGPRAAQVFQPDSAAAPGRDALQQLRVTRPERLLFSGVTAFSEKQAIEECAESDGAESGMKEGDVYRRYAARGLGLGGCCSSSGWWGSGKPHFLASQALGSLWLVEVLLWLGFHGHESVSVVARANVHCFLFLLHCCKWTNCLDRTPMVKSGNPGSSSLGAVVLEGRAALLPARAPALR